MVLQILRALFILLMAAVGYSYVSNGILWGSYSWMAIHTTLVVGVLFVCIDILTPRRKLTIFAGTFFGLLVGLLVAYGLSFAVRLIVEQLEPETHLQLGMEHYVDLMVGLISCYLSISFVLQTKDDFRFIIPYVEFTRQYKGPRPMVLDTSILIDGRIADIAATGMLENQIIVPRFVLLELQGIADSPEKLRRNRGRRGLDVLSRLQDNKRAEVILYETAVREETESVDQRLMDLASQLNARVLTTDFNLNKVAQLRGVDVINVNDLATALKPVVLPGERMSVRVIKHGEEAGQGVGYLDDGTMVVIEQGRQHVNEEVEFTVTSVLQTSAGKMIFGRVGGDNASGGRRTSRSRGEPPQLPTPTTTAPTTIAPQ